MLAAVERSDRYRCGHMAHVLVLASISESLVNAISHFVRDAGLPGIFALMALSSACIPIPSEVVMLFAGFAVADPTQSAAHHHMTMTGVVLAGLLGTMVGLLVRLRRRAGRVAWSCSNATAPSCTWDRPRSSGPTASSSATAS